MLGALLQHRYGSLEAISLLCGLGRGAPGWVRLRDVLGMIGETIMAEIALTNPAADLFEFCALARAHSNSEDLIRNVLPQFFGCEADSAQFYRIAGIVFGRFDDLSAAVRSSTKIPEEMKKVSLDHIIGLRGFLHPGRSHEPWRTTVAQSLRDDRMTALQYVDLLLRDEWPLRRFTSEEQKKFIESAKTFLADMEREPDLSEVVRNVVSFALRDLIFVVERFQFFGYAYVHERVALANGMLGMAEDVARAQTNSAAIDQSRFLLKRGRVIVASLAAALIFYGDIRGGINAAIGDASTMYSYGVQLMMSQQRVSNLPALAPPVSDESKAGEDAQGSPQNSEAVEADTAVAASKPESVSNDQDEDSNIDASIVGTGRALSVR